MYVLKESVVFRACLRGSTSVVKFLLKHGARKDKPSNTGKIPFHIGTHDTRETRTTAADYYLRLACQNGNLDIAKMMEDATPDPANQVCSPSKNAFTAFLKRF